MNTLAKEIFKPKLFSDQHERFEKEYPGFHQMIYDSMEEYAKAYAPVPGKEEYLKRLLANWHSLYEKYANDNPSEDMLADATKAALAASPSTASNEDKRADYELNSGRINKPIVVATVKDDDDKTVQQAAKEYGEWQLCPKCGGNGSLQIGELTLDGKISFACSVCGGNKIIERPIIAGASFNKDAVEEKDLIIHGIEEGAENWKMEYDNCRSILEFLVELKDVKDRFGKNEFYEKNQPSAWERAKEFLEKYTHIDY